MQLAGMDRRAVRHGALWLGGGMAIATAMAAALWPAPAASAVDKSYSITAVSSPAVPEDDAPADDAAEVWAGATPRVGVTITNTSSNPQALGSVNVGIPSAITPLAGSALITSTQSPFAGTVTLVGAQLQLRNLNLAPGKSVTATVLARVTCAPSAASYPLSSAAKQSNDFNGTGNDFSPTGTAALDAVGACTLAFTTQPASAQREADITGDVYLPFSATPPGAPVAVTVRDGSGAAPVSWWATPVSLALSTNPGAAALHGTTSATPDGGVATFKSTASTEPGPRIGVSASGYRLTASSAGITTASAPSSAFDIVDVGKRCTSATTCTGQSSSAKSTAKVNVTAGDGDILRLSLGAVGTPVPVCAGYAPTTDVLDFDVTTPAGTSTGGQRTVLFTLFSAYVTKPANKYDACFQSTLPFTTKSGLPAVPGGGYYTGLLPDCARTAPVAPCEVASDRTRAGDIVMTLIAPPGDPRARF